MSAIQKPQASIPNTTLTVDNVLPRDHAAPHIQSTTTNANRETRYRPAPTKTQSSSGTNGKKRKHTSEKTRPIQYFEDTDSDDDANDESGDGTSSGDSIDSNAAPLKRQKVSRVATWSSARGAVPGTMVGAPGSASVSLATVTNTNDAVGTDGDVNTNIDNTHTDTNDAHIDTDDAHTDTDDVVHFDIDDMVHSDIEDVVHSDVEDVVHSDANNVVQTDTDTEDITTTSPRASPLMSLDDIDVADIPAFLL